MKCIIVDDDELSKLALMKLVGQVQSLTLIRDFSGSAEALNFVNNEEVDLILLDIEMPDMNGLEFIKSLKKTPLIILVTSKKEYALEAYEYNVVDYLVKPIPLPRFIKAITKAEELFNTSEQMVASSEKDYVFIKSKSVLVKVFVNDILWIEALGDYITVNTATKKHIIHTTMKGVESRLPSNKFIRVHRSYIISMDRIDTIDDTIVVIGGKLIPVGAVYKENLMQKLKFL